MKVKYDGDWIGLGHMDPNVRRIGDFSTPDKWKIGFDIVYRLIFYTDDRKITEEFRKAFKKSFGLADQHYELGDDGSGHSVFWRIYWDRGEIPLSLLNDCENEVDTIAVNMDTKVALIEITVVPRSLNTIKQTIADNK